MQTKYSQDYIAEFADCDRYYNLKGNTLLAWCSEIAGNHLRSRDITREQMWQDGQVFLLTSAAAHYYKSIKYNEKLKLTTWEGGTKGIRFIRRFELHNHEGELLCDLETMWVLVNPQSHKILRPSEYAYELIPDSSKTTAVCGKMKCEQSGEAKLYKFVFSDIDPNGHVNNGVYLRLALDILPESYTTREIIGWQISFDHESRQGQNISLYKALRENSAEIVGITENGTIGFEMQIDFT